MRFTNLNYFDPNQVKQGTRVLMRLDANVDPEDIRPLRILRALPDIEAILDRGGRLMLMTHRGRPKGKEATLSTKHLIPRLEALLERPVLHVTEFTQQACQRKWQENPEAVLLFENLRFFDEEEENKRAFAKVLAKTADLYINNAFGVCHRKHASVHAITKYVPSFAGVVLRQELHALNKPFESPFVIVLGGVKLETKVPLLKKLAPRASSILLGSAFLIEDESLSLGAKCLRKKYQDKMHVPIDIRIASGKNIIVRPADYELKEGEKIIDIGPDAEMVFASTLLDAKSILWNGPVGIAEEEDGKNGTLSIIDALRHAKQARIVIGGGDTIELIDEEDAEDHIFLSTGGGATLALLSGAKMPGLSVLEK